MVGMHAKAMRNSKLLKQSCGNRGKSVGMVHGCWVIVVETNCECGK